MSPLIESKPKRDKNTSQVVRIDLCEEYGCSICQEDLKEADILVYCKVGCGHNFHVKCMKVWAEFKVTKKDPITCPLCRSTWGDTTLNELNRMLRKNKKPAQIHSNTSCINCGISPISGTKYHCVVCPNLDFCGKCFKVSHTEHPFIQKTTPTSPWEPAIRNNQDVLINREFSPEDYDLLQQLDNKPCLSEYLYSILPDCHPGICAICNGDIKTKWKKFACGHSAHDVRNI